MHFMGVGGQIVQLVPICGSHEKEKERMCEKATGLLVGP